MAFSDLKIRTRILSGFAVLILGSVFMALYASAQFSSTSRTLNDIVESHIDKISLTKGLQDNVNLVARGVRNIALLTDPEKQQWEKQRIEKASAANTELFTKLAATQNEPRRASCVGGHQGCAWCVLAAD
jgi:methyl-accepting chemotaxis protein